MPPPEVPIPVCRPTQIKEDGAFMTVTEKIQYILSLEQQEHASSPESPLLCSSPLKDDRPAMKDPVMVMDAVKDPGMVMDKTNFQISAEAIFKEWMLALFTDGRPLQDYILFNLIRESGMYINEETMLRLLKVFLDICTGIAYRFLNRSTSPEQPSSVDTRCYTVIDAYSNLVWYVFCFFSKIRNGI